MLGGVGIDDEDAVHSLVDVTRQRQRMAVIEMAAEGARLELVSEFTAGRHEPGTRYPIHSRRVESVEVHGMRMRAEILEDDTNPVAFGGAQRRSRHAAIEGPGREHDTRRDLDLLVFGGHLKGA